jgi:hypothetical protein
MRQPNRPRSPLTPLDTARYNLAVALLALVAALLLAALVAPGAVNLDRLLPLLVPLLTLALGHYYDRRRR